jgi:16S rRNA (cytosine967-C5)-methyltransferase
MIGSSAIAARGRRAHVGRMAPPIKDAAGVPARRAALRLLDAVLRRGLALEAALPAATRDLPRDDDRALAHALAATVLRRLPQLDALIDRATPRRLPDDAKARSVLRLALAQALALGTPPHAAVATVLPLVDGGPRKLVHGVFGAVMRGGWSLPAEGALPAAVATRWGAAWSDDAVAAAATLLAEPPPLDLSLRDPAATARWAEALGGASLAPGHVRVARGARVEQLAGYAEGAWWVQDLAASLPARLVPADARAVVDLCAAPGGKTLQLAAAGHAVTAVDVSPSRLARLRGNLARTGLSAQVVAADARSWAPPAPVDAVLLDAPCSATGIFRRHPDVLHRATPALVGETAALQAELLSRAAAWLRPGGTLVYATCSLEPEEGEMQVAAFLASHPSWTVAAPAGLPPGIAAAPEGWLRTLPGTLADEGGCDGFFVAALRRRG